MDMAAVEVTLVPSIADAPAVAVADTGGVNLDCEFRKMAKLRAAVKLQVGPLKE
ncbi:hypothetical protein UY3_04866 [Chelonia mydas]|uniref:Uncharacterized protein n=1 Tax=Chelonia mydas TaxID=8469 RepID=M7BJ55_CHEMY|nr:hypothetical protein UY3_04866 [Chelonia mydas]